MSTPLHRALLGFLAAVISVLTFHQGMWALLHLAGQMPPPYPTRGVPPWGVLLGWRLGGCLRIGSAEALRQVSNVGAWTLTGDCGGAGWLVRRPAHQGFASSRWLVRYGVRAIISDQRVLGNWRRSAVAAPDPADSINGGLSLFCTTVGFVPSTNALPHVHHQWCVPRHCGPACA